MQCSRAEVYLALRRAASLPANVREKRVDLRRVTCKNALEYEQPQKCTRHAVPLRKAERSLT